MFSDSRSKSVVFVAHCILNQNSISDGTAAFPGSIKEIVDILIKSGAGIVQMPCPELMCLNLDRGNMEGYLSPVIEENSRIRNMLTKKPALHKIQTMVADTAFQIEEYQKHGFTIKGIVGIDRSPSCGVNTTSKDNGEIDGQGLFIKSLQTALKHKDIRVNFIGIKAFELDNAIESFKKIFS